MKNGIIFAQFVALGIVIPLYIGALGDAKDARQQAQSLYDKLPGSQQEELRQNWETRQALLGDAPPRDRY